MTTYYDQLVPRLMREERLSNTERLFLIFLVELCRKEGYCHHPMWWISDETHISEAAISDAISKLLELGYIRGSKVPTLETGRDSWRIELVGYVPSQETTSQQVIIRPPDQDQQEEEGWHEYREQASPRPSSSKTVTYSDKKIRIILEIFESGL